MSLCTHPKMNRTCKSTHTNTERMWSDAGVGIGMLRGIPLLAANRNRIKSIAIHQESLINNLGIVKTPNIPSNFIKIQEFQKVT